MRRGSRVQMRDVSVRGILTLTLSPPRGQGIWRSTSPIRWERARVSVSFGSVEPISRSPEYPVKPGTSKSRRKARVLVVDDHPLFRDGLVQLINRQPDLTCCGEAGTAADALAALSLHKPDLALLDLRLGSADGLDVIKSFKAQCASVLILVLSQSDEALYAERALRAGASGYVMKEEATEEVLLAIRTILKGETYVSRKIAALVLHKLLRQTPDSPEVGIQSLTNRELQVFQLLGSGNGTRQIAQALNLSVKTIETYRGNIKNKLGFKDGADLVRQAKGWVEGNPPPRPRA